MLSLLDPLTGCQQPQPHRIGYPIHSPNGLTAMTLSPADVAYSHLVDDTERSRTAALRSATRIDAVISDLRHAIANGRTDAALDLLTTLDTANRAVLDAVRTAPATN